MGHVKTCAAAAGGRLFEKKKHPA